MAPALWLPSHTRSIYSRMPPSKLSDRPISYKAALIIACKSQKSVIPRARTVIWCAPPVIRRARTAVSCTQVWFGTVLACCELQDCYLAYAVPENSGIVPARQHLRGLQLSDTNLAGLLFRVRFASASQTTVICCTAILGPDPTVIWCTGQSSAAPVSYRHCYFVYSSA